ncbi:MAG: tetratricopeptide repeat protein, partial [Endozoicomonas sp.]
MGGKLKPIALGLLFSALSGCVSTDSRPMNENQAVADYMKLARGYIEQGYTEKAVKPLKRALEIEPGSVSALGMLGMVYQLQGEYDFAEEAFKMALSRDPKASDVRNNYGAFLFSQNRLQEAYRQFELASGDVSYSQRSRTFE